MSLSSTRARRENAGSRMQALVQQQLQDGQFDDDVLDDVEDYVVEVQDDVFDEDFGSTDEDEEQIDGEAKIQEEEKAARQSHRRTKVLISKAKPFPQPAVRSSTDKPSVTKAPVKRPRTKAKEALANPLLSSVRQSNRSSTIAAKKQLQQKLVETSKRRALVPPRPRVAEVELTQEQKLEEAKETEKINLASLNRIIQSEEDNRLKRAHRVERAPGPIIRFRSFRCRLVEEAKEKVDTSSSMDIDNGAASSDDQIPPLLSHEPPSIHSAEEGAHAENPSSKEQFVSKNHIIFDGFTEDPFEKWNTQCKEPEQQRCPITGLRARYRDPKTSIPYATKDAYAVLQRLINGQYAWSPVCQTYIHPFNAVPPAGTPHQWIDSTFGQVVAREEVPEKPKVKKLSKDKGKPTEEGHTFHVLQEPGNDSALTAMGIDG
ncbi:hypothetical protein PhCBS80983_g04015 [Powellomyces hirtus]|uniref:Vps72/YL1 C-terminal domain-containing protein n=1 Tax=Powellomyces hirtus TaxID=109895 RepID=A0A507DZU2_9FUNG|nr:hypothetical protein PhCBS80983_g04015 [Powellomyces hirtus]